ncbi:hypothetical protein DL766_000310 [Monosporascus sp. MC13-8B]|uniref:Uncharacterized protein n=1 Tax=Monosporascus cannonballus TaxID=155416 RepID=A0ABY0H1M9_9PEZI|nr:hypothetical protein DL762_006560 [Monosporascus cannonballus]RYO84332.1 hypothetical protein DL763_007503 [Monosporascus cannonballus]RYP39648.1 hypothetical protein DL766_000310 [Monosporascus sp. MC13-8B]
MQRIMIPVALALVISPIILGPPVAVGVINAQPSPIALSQTCTVSASIGEDNLINEYSAWNPNIDFDSSGYVPATLICDRPVEKLEPIMHQTAAALDSSLSPQPQPAIKTGVCHSHIGTNTHTPVLMESALSTVLDEPLIAETPLADAALPTQVTEVLSGFGNPTVYGQSIPLISEEAQLTGPHDMTAVPDNGSLLDIFSHILKRFDPGSRAGGFASALAETRSAEYTIPTIFNPEFSTEGTSLAHPITTTPAVESLALPRIKPKIIWLLGLVVAAASAVFRRGKRLKRFGRRRNARLYPSPSESPPSSPSRGTPPPGLPELNFDPAKEARMAPEYKAAAAGQRSGQSAAVGDPSLSQASQNVEATTLTRSLANRRPAALVDAPWCTVMIYGLDKKWGKMAPRRYGAKRYTAPPLLEMPLVEEVQEGDDGADGADFE